MTVRVREGGRTVLVHALIAAGVNADGKREILGLDITLAEPGPAGGSSDLIEGITLPGLNGRRTNGD